MKIREIMNSQVHTIDCDESVAEAAFVIKETGSACLVVLDGDRVAGIITEWDMVLGCLLDSHISWNCSVYRHMQVQSDVISASAEASDAAILMFDKGLAYIPVVERRRLIGLLSSEKVAPFINARITRLPVA